MSSARSWSKNVDKKSKADPPSTRWGWEVPSDDPIRRMGTETATLDQYWSDQATELRHAFKATRSAHRDSDVRGSRNELVVAEFLRSRVSPRTVLTNTTLIDSSGFRTNEIDVAVCNADQPYWSEKFAPPLIIEGVDVVIQVKARLDAKELSRIRNECEKVKSLHKIRSSNDDETAFGGGFRSTFLDFVPYFVISFDSHLKAQTAADYFNATFNDVHPDYRPDGLFVLDKFSLLPSHEFKVTGDGVLGPHPVEPALSGRRTLALFMFCLFTYPPRVRRRWHPITAYWNAGGGEPFVSETDLS